MSKLYTFQYFPNQSLIYIYTYNIAFTDFLFRCFHLKPIEKLVIDFSLILGNTTIQIIYTSILRYIEKLLSLQICYIPRIMLIHQLH